MLWFEFKSPVLVLAGCLLFLALVTLVTRIMVRTILGRDWLQPRVKVPWRFSLLAIAVLTVLMGCVFAVMRDSPDLAIIAAGCVAFLWFPIARFSEYCQTLADRRNKKLEAAIDAKRKDGPHGD